MARRPGLGGVVSTRTREDAREAAGRIGAEDEPSAPPAYAPQPGAELVSAPDDDLVAAGESDGDNDDLGAAGEVAANGSYSGTVEQTAPAARVSNRGRGARQAAAPASLLPSRVPQHRIQIGPRLRPSAHTRFTEYLHELANTGVTQSDIVESALIEYMNKYPPEALRAALLEGR